MGVTIHFQGKLKSDAAYKAFINAAQVFADEMGWPYSKIEEKETLLKRVKDEKDWDYYGLVKGIEIFPHDSCEPFRLEFDKDLIIQEYTKTQFAPIEIHVLLVDFLEKQTENFEELLIFDEGEFHETKDISVLGKHLENCNSAIDEYLSQTDKYRGPVRLPSGRITDVVSI